ncbi:MAG: NADH-quinone oxidoreductase subunit J [Thermoleophilaceae bacterium]|nr:NADH-quinone oxidoreductase subunit J [Thermoleophilaceae bacterium]
MVLRDIVFFLAAIGALAGALGVVMLRNPFYSVLSLVGHLLSLAILFLLLSSEFLAAAQLVVYAGAVMVLYVFVVAYIGGADEPLGPAVPAVGAFGPLVAAALCGELFFAFIGSGLEALDSRGAHVSPGFGSPGQIGSLLLRNFLIPFEAASFLLLVAAVGALVLARRRRGIDDEEGGARVDTIGHARAHGSEPAPAEPVAPGVER